MADTKISDLNALTYLTGTYLVPAVDIPDDADGTKKVTLSNFWLATDGIIPAALVYNNADITISTATATDLTFNSELFDTDVIHDTSTNSNRLTCKTAGKYFVFSTLEWDTNSTNQRISRLTKNGDLITYSSQEAISNFRTGQITSCFIDLAVNDYVTCNVFHNEGGNLDIKYLATRSPVFGMIRIGD